MGVSGTESVVIIDTSVCLHYKPIDQVDWLGWLGSKKVRILIAPVTIRELNDQKDNGNTRAIRQRAFRTLQLIERAADADGDIRIRANVFLGLISNEYSDFADRQLDSTCNDDRLIVAALHYKEETGAERVYIAANDVGLKVKAKPRGLTVMKPPKEWELEATLDEDEKELKRLRAQVATRPQLSVTFHNKAVFAEYDQIEPLPYDAGFIDRCVNKVQAKLPFVDPAFAPLASPEAVREYKGTLLQFCEDFRAFLSDWLPVKQATTRTIALELFVHNEGSCPATDVRIDLIFPTAGMEILKRVEPLPDCPAKPPRFEEWCAKNFSGYDWMNDDGITIDEREGESVSPRLVQSAAILTVQTNRANIRLTKVQHQAIEALPIVYVRFEDYNEMDGFPFEVRLISDEMQASNATLNVRVTKSRMKSVLWEIPYVHS